MVRPQSFPPERRLHDDRDYSRVFTRQQKAAGPHLVALVRPRRRGPVADGAVLPPRLGIMVSTKVSPLSVRRHQLKRWVRELFRRRLQAELGEWDLVVLFRRDPPEHSHEQIDREVCDQVRRALAAAAQPEHRRRDRDPRRGRAPPPERPR